MSNINFSNTAPAATAGRTNVAFAVDGSNDISASIATPLVAANNLSDVASAAAALTNLIGGWQTWTPTFAGAGSMTISGVTVNDAQYVRIGPLVHLKMSASMTLGGTANVFITISGLPLASVGGNSITTSAISNASGGYAFSFGYIPGASSNIVIGLTAYTSFALGACTIYVQATYRVA